MIEFNIDTCERYENTNLRYVYIVLIFQTAHSMFQSLCFTLYVSHF